MKQILKTLWDILEESGKARAASWLARHGYTAESIALMKK
jgi:hypothetical protein